MRIMDLSELLADRDEEKKPSILPEAKVMELRAALERYERLNCQFNIGDLVTPRANSPLHGAGDPHIIAEIFYDPLRISDGNAGKFGCHGKYDVRIIAASEDGTIIPFMAESWMLEPYTGEGASIS